MFGYTISYREKRGALGKPLLMSLKGDNRADVRAKFLAIYGRTYTIVRVTPETKTIRYPSN